MLQSVAVCCSVLQCVAEYCSYMEARCDVVVEMYGVIYLCVVMGCSEL